ncbi:hypothetical protein [Zhongshania sp.]|uniref:hypothetical protein n=1 Tax=Zhongshania sp. TaxID=1971902 RepID=UPI003564EFC8
MNAGELKGIMFGAVLAFSLGGVATPALAQLPGGAGIGIPFGIDPMAVAGVGVDLFSGIALENGLGAVPLIGSDLATLGTPDGAQAGVLTLAEDQALPVGLPVIGRKPQRLYGSVFFALLGTYGVPLAGAAPEFDSSLATDNFTEVLTAFPIPMP